jgi:hypothetical protein
MEVNIAENRIYLRVHFKVKNGTPSHPLSRFAHLIIKRREMYGNIIL